MSLNDDKNSVCSEKEEELEVKDKEVEDESEDEKKDKNENDEEEDEEDEDEEDEDDDEEESDDDDEFDPTIIQYELLKNFLVDEEGNNVATHLGAIAHELRRLSKILSKK
jgi:hypothetical protein